MYRIISLITLFFLLLISQVFAEDFYVTSAGAGGADGSSWANAWSWSDLNTSGNWSATDVGGKIDADDTVYISGGASGQAYTAPLTIYASGSSGSPITIKPGSASASPSGHDGLVTIQNGGTHNIIIGGYDWITIDGEKAGACNIKNLNADEHGVYASSAIGIVIKYMEITEWNDASTTSVDAIKLRNCRTGNEVAYCTMYSPTFGGGVDVMHMSADWTYDGSFAYGDNSIHHNTMYDFCDDAINVGAGVDIYENDIDMQHPTLRDYGHPDCIPAQGSQADSKGSHHIRIWNNLIQNFPSMMVYAEGFNDVHHFRIYNNIFEFTEHVTASSWEGISIAVRSDAGGTGQLHDIAVVNNVFVNIPGKAIEFKQLKSGGDLYDVDIKNNIIINCACANTSEPAIHVSDVGGTLDADIDYNVIVDGANGVETINWAGSSYSVATFNSTFSKNNSNTDPSFVSYSDGNPYTASNDYHLQSGDTACKEQGVDLSGLSNMDATWPNDYDGVARPQGTNWDIGAYELLTDTANLTGTLSDGATEAQIVAGGETLIITLPNNTWAATVGADNAITTALITGLDSGGTEAAGWDAEVKGDGTNKLTHAEVVRTSNTVVTITLTAKTYAITTNETVTLTIPVSTTSSDNAIVATPTFEITADPAITIALSGTYADGATEAETKAGTEGLIITLTNDTWAATMGTDVQLTKDLIAGIDSAQSEATGWDAEIKGDGTNHLTYADITRTNDTTVTIDFGAEASYSITDHETVTVTVPASALVTSGDAVVATPTFIITAANPSAALSGTLADGATEAQVAASGETCIITLTEDTWVAAGATFDAQRQAIIDGFDSAQSETLGWNNEVRDKEVVTAVVRTNATTVTVTFTAAGAAYDISANETLTITVPAAALVTSGAPLTATPTVAIIFFETSSEEIKGITMQ